MSIEAARKFSAMVVQLSTDELRAIIKDEVQAALKATPETTSCLTPRR